MGQSSHIISSHNRPVKDEQGRAIAGEAQNKRWREHFERLLNREAPQNRPNISLARQIWKIDSGEPQKEEILNAIKQLNNNKSAGPDSIYILYKVYQALKADSKTRADILQPLFKNILKNIE